MFILANFKPPLTPDEVKKAGVAEIRKKYNALAETYNSILEGKYFYCHKCNAFHNVSAFYSDKRYASGFYPDCRESLFEEATDFDKETKTRKDNREKTMHVFQKLDLPFLDALYRDALNTVNKEGGERTRSTAYQQMLVMVKTLNQYKNLTWKDSQFDEESGDTITLVSNRKPKKETIKRFGSGFTTEEYLYLQDQYEDWCARTQVDSKSQETYIIRICFKLLEIWKAQKQGNDTTKLDESLNKLMDAAKLQPKQNVGNAATDSLSFGELIERWEMNAPIPEPDPELSDVSGIGKNFRVWVSGWLAHALGLNIPESEEFKKEVSKYTVDKPSNQENSTSNIVYNQLFGKDGESDE